MAAAFTNAWGNPASVHSHGGLARARIEEARAAVAELAGADVRDVIFTSGGTEANNMAIVSALDAWTTKNPGAIPCIATSRLEHPSVVEMALALQRQGRATIAWLPALSSGVPDLDVLQKFVRTQPIALICMQSLNHETGAIQPVGDTLSLARTHGIPVHVDAVQAWGKLEQTWIEAAYRTLAAHKIQGPKGMGALITRPFEKISRVMQGGAQERGLRAGTPDPVGAAGFAVAARQATNMHVEYLELRSRRDALEAAVLAMHPKAFAVAAAHRAPHVSNMVFPGIRSSELVAVLDVEGVSVSAGAACSAGTVEPSRVIEAIHGSAAAGAAIRVSFGPSTSEEELSRATAVFARVLPRFA
jgi:cysteine desulfurase